MAEMPDQDWLEGIYRLHRRSLFLTAWNVLRCPSLAEDAVHSAFVRLTELPVAPRQPKLYVIRAVRNAAIDLARIRGRRQEEEIPVDEPHPHFVARAAETDSLAAAHIALAQLDEKSREVIELHLHGRLTFQEIAAICDEPLQTVTSRYRRALEKLRQLLEVCYE
jgi:RNA polymerase sigma-70 factor (ECF subfamily)